MPISNRTFKPTGLAGCKWDRRSKLALFEASRGRGKERVRVRRVYPFESVERAKAAFPAFKASVKGGLGAATPGSEVEPPPAMSELLEAESVREYVRKHWETLHVRCSASTQKTNERMYRLYLKPSVGGKKVADVAECDCEDLSAQMKAEGYSPYTTNLALRVLRKILHHARRRSIRGAVPDDFHFQKEPLLKLELNDNEQMRFFAAFDDEQGFRRLLAAKRKDGKVIRSRHFGFKERRFGGGLKPESEAASYFFQRFRAARLIFIAAVDLGFRETDLRLLRRVDVSLRTGVVSITSGKTKKTATVPLSDRCREAIKNALAMRVNHTEYVFCTPDGRPYSESTLNRYFALAKKLANITRRCRLNDLRHTFGSNLASAGVSLIEIRDALGHTSTRTTERYAKPDVRSLERIREALNRRHGGASVSTADGVEEG